MAEQKKRGPGRPKGSKNKKQATPVSAKTKEERIREMQEQRHADRKVIDEIWAITIIALGILFFFTIFLDTTGAFGQKIHDICLGLFGFMAYVLPFLLVIGGLLLFAQKLQHINARTAVFSILIYINLCVLNSYRFINESKLAYGFIEIAQFYEDGIAGKKGGAVGMEIGSLLVKFFGMPGLLIIAISIILISLLLVANTPISNGIDKIKNKREEKRILFELDAAERKKNEQLQLNSAPAQSAGRPPQLIESQSKNVATNNAPKILEPSKYTKTTKSSKTTPELDEESKKKMFDLFKADDNFSPSEDETSADYMPSYNKEEKEWIGRPEKNKSYGLNGTVEKHEGYGLNGYDEINFNAFKNNMKHIEDAVDEMPEMNTPMQVAGATAVASNVIGAVSEFRPAGSHATERRLNELESEEHAKNSETGKKSKSEHAKDAKDNVNTDDVANDITSGLENSGTDELYKLPPIDLLKKGRGGKQMMSDYQLEQKSALLQHTLADFGVDAKVLSVTQGASVTRYEVQPATGVKVSKITSLVDDIALNMRAKSIRIEAPIPGKAAVGIEVENDKPSTVLVRDLIDSPEFANSESKLTFVVGKDISGNNIVADLKGMPHLLIAGATGSGKSVCINSIIASFLYKAKPSELRLIMIDPKVVELGNYNGIPHLLTPVVTDPRKAARALGEAVAEMNKRYEDFAKWGVKDLSSYNELMRANMEPQNCKPEVVIIIDELADLMMASPTQVEESICRLAQKARAAGMHLIVATQRPSVDVVTGLIKANIPSRIAFSVASQIDSRTILDMAGAEKLLGKGDMLFSPVGSSKPYRVQGPYISDSETAKIIDFVRRQGKTDYNEELSNAIENNGESKSDSVQDELTEDAIAFILKSKQASVSMLQRRFRIGYNRAARIIDEIEERGIVGPSDGSRPRQVLITEDEYYGNSEEVFEGDQDKAVIDDANHNANDDGSADVTNNADFDE